MLLILFCGILIGFNQNLEKKQMDNTTMDKAIITYSAQQLLRFRSPLPNSIIDKKVLTRLKDLELLVYRGKRAGRPRQKDTNDGIHWDNLTKIKLDPTIALNENRKSRLKIATVNSRSLRGKSAQLLQHMLEESIDLCVISETWLSNVGDDLTRGELKQDGFDFDDVPRTDRNGGGVGLLYRSNLRVTRTSTNSFRSFEYAEWKITCKTFVFLVVGIYRPPYSEKHPVTKATFMTEFKEYLEELSLKSEAIVLLGDFNLHMDNSFDCYANQFSQLLHTFGFAQNVKKPTHTSGHILDLIITRKKDKLSDITEPLTDSFISDHCFVSCFVEQSRPPLTVKNVSTRSWKSVSTDTFQNDLSQLNSLVSKSENVDELVSNFTKSTSAIIEKHAPLKEKTIVVRLNISWYSRYHRLLKQYKRSVEKIFLNDSSKVTEQAYKNVRNSYTAAISMAKEEYFRSKINDAKGDIKKLYGATACLLGRTKNNPLPPYSSEVKLANNFLRFFVDKIATIRNDLDSIDPGHINHSIAEDANVSSYVHKLCCFKSLDENDVHKLITSSKSTTCELDVIPTQKLKDNLSHFIPVITSIINESLSSGVFPNEWKCAVIRPLLKKNGLPLELKNYRPVSNLSFLSKILEKSALQQITAHIESYNLLPTYQSAYRKCHSVETAMLKMYSDLLDTIDRGYVTIVVMIDLSAAFDTVDISTVLTVLRDDFGITDIPLKWIQSYLTERTMKVMINTASSDTEHVHYGVPQRYLQST